MLVDLPPELWLWVLKSLNFDNLKAVSLTCQRLRALATPRLFRCLVLVGANTKDVDGLARVYCAANIAPLVREVLFAHPVLQESILEAIFAVLHQFPNLDTFYFESMDIHAFLPEIEKLPALKTMFMQNCTYSSLSGPCFRLRRIQLLNSIYSGSKSWPFTIQPELLEFLHIGGVAFPMVSFLPNLRVLRVESDCYPSGNDIPPVISFLRCCSCPSLEVLVLEESLPDEQLARIDGTAPPLVPNLKIYYGPAAFLPLFASGGSLLRVTLWESDQPEHFVDLAEILHELLPRAPNLIALKANAISVNELVLRAACQFAYLEELHLKTALGKYISAQDLITVLRNLCLPSRLRCLILESHFRESFKIGARMKKDMTLLMRANPQLRAFAVQMDDSSHRWASTWFIFLNRRNTRYDDGVIDVATREDWLENEYRVDLFDWIHSILDGYASSTGLGSAVDLITASAWR